MHLADCEVIVRSMTCCAGFAQLCSVGQRVRRDTFVVMASSARCRGWSHGSDESPRILDRQQVVLQRKLLRAVDVALGAIAAVSGEAHVVESVLRAAKPVDCIVCCQVFAGMDLMNHEREVDRLRRAGRCWPNGGVGPTRVVAQYAHRDLVTIVAMNSQAGVAAVATGRVHHRAPGSRTFFISFVVPGRSVILRSPSMPIEYVPLAPVAIAFWKVYMQVPSLPHVPFVASSLNIKE